MIRLNLVLLLAVVASAMYLVRLQYESRVLFTALDRAQATEWGTAHCPCPLRMAGVGELTLQPQGVQQADGEIGA